MKEYVDSRFSKSVRRATIAIVAAGAIAAQTVYARASTKIVVVQPKDLPELARQSGEAMFLHDTFEGKTFLYIEQNRGGRLVILDVTDPAHVTREGSVNLDAAGPFDFVSELGERKELVHFRHSQNDAALNLHKADAPTLEEVQGLMSPGPTMPLGDEGFTVTRRADAEAGASARAPRDYQVVDTADSKEPTLVFTVKQVREEITNDETGTTFLLANDGLYLIRRPIEESDKWLREMEYND
ncbi:MAG: hypothetical protein JWM63_1010 [Gammaproteobacteria bacterium]|nr:hypothetical protein [Gammaproteobacteria bacterium]